MSTRARWRTGSHQATPIISECLRRTRPAHWSAYSGMTRAQEPRALFQEFLAAAVKDAVIPDQLKKWEHARAEWRKQWLGRGAASAEVLFDRLTPRAASAGSDGWEHPVAEEAAELKSWRTAWRSAAPADRRQLASAFVNVLARIETEPASSHDAFTELARSATTSGLPLVV